MKIEELILNEERNVRLSAWIQDVGGEFGQIQKRSAILILPGGAYSMCSDREAEPVAAAYAKAGFQAFILRYSVGEHKAWPNPLDDYEQAMELLWEKADNWHIDIDRIAVAGFTAAGFDKPIVSRTLNSDCEPMLSLNCTVSHLKKQNEKVQELLAKIFEGIDHVVEQRFGGSSSAKELVYSYKMKDLLQMFSMPEETVNYLEEQLQKIENIK